MRVCRYFVFHNVVCWLFVFCHLNLLNNFSSSFFSQFFSLPPFLIRLFSTRTLVWFAFTPFVWVWLGSWLIRRPTSLACTCVGHYSDRGFFSISFLLTMTLSVLVRFFVFSLLPRFFPSTLELHSWCKSSLRSLYRARTTTIRISGFCGFFSFFAWLYSVLFFGLWAFNTLFFFLKKRFLPVFFQKLTFALFTNSISMWLKAVCHCLFLLPRLFLASTFAFVNQFL